MRSITGLFTLIVFLLCSINSALSFELKGEFTQGSLIRGKAPSQWQVWLNDEALKVSPEGYFAFGFGRDAKLEHALRWIDENGEIQVKDIVLTKREYNVQRIEGLPPKMVTPPQDVLVRIKQDNQQVALARKTNDDRIDFVQSFIWPSDGPISGVYGSQRVLNGEPRRPHFGVDVAAPTGTPVVSPADGVVTLWVPDMYYSGGTMIIDHGHRISSTFLHLHAAHVEVGDRVKQGQLVAEIGATGRVTGAHLDWRMNWRSQRVDPALLVPARQ